MKKIIILILFCFICVGCYDYQELNDRAIIVGIAIDYEDNEYIVNFEVLNSNKSGQEQSGPNESYLIEGKGETFTRAYQNALFSLNKDAYLAHLKAAVFSEEIAKDHLDSIVDYLIRDPDTRNVFYPVVAKDKKAKEILDATSKEVPVISTAIEGLIDYNNYKESITTNINFESFLELLFSKNEDAYINVVSLEEDNRLTAEGIAIFKDWKMVNLLNDTDAATLLLLNNKSNHYYIKMKCEEQEDKFLTLDLYDNKGTDLEVNEQEIKVNSMYNANIMDDECSYNFRDPKIYSQIADQFKNIMEEITLKEVKKYQFFKSDVLGLERKYYIKTKKEIKNWDTLPINVKSEIRLNKNGIIFEVTNQ